MMNCILYKKNQLKIVKTKYDNTFVQCFNDKTIVIWICIKIYNKIKNN